MDPEAGSGNVLRAVSMKMASLVPQVFKVKKNFSRISTLCSKYRFSDEGCWREVKRL